MKVFLLMILSVSILSASANAQVYTSPRLPVVNIDPWVNLRIGQIGNQMSADMARANQAQKNRSKTTTKPNSSKVNYSTLYKKEFAFIRSENSPLAEKFAESQKGNKEQNFRQMNELIAGLWRNYERSYEIGHREIDIPYDDVATVMSYYIVMNYMRLNNISFLNSKTVAAVYGQISTVLLKDNSFAKLKSDEKQLMAEFLLLTGEMPTITFNRNRNNAELKELSKQNLARIFGDRAEALTITENGIEF